MREKLINRAIELWVKELCMGEWDNGDKSIHGEINKSLVARIRALCKLTDQMLADFSLYLKEAVIDDNTSDDDFYTGLCVDYNPCPILAHAADKAGIDHSFFPCKTSIDIHLDCVSAKRGYGAEKFFHYPTDKGWLITRLQGRDMYKVIEYVEGKTPQFNIEQ